MQELRRTIQTQASNRKNQKNQELCTLSGTHATLLKEIRRLDHQWTDYKDRRGYSRCSHDRNCRRCAKEREAAGLEITVFEWPLPEEDSLSRLVLFELCVPEVLGFGAYHVLFSAKPFKDRKGRSKPDHADMVLQNYSFLEGHFKVSHGKQRITIASTAKSFLQSHYSRHNFLATKAISSRSILSVSTTHTQMRLLPNNLTVQSSSRITNGKALGISVLAIDLANPTVHLLFQQAAWQAETASEGGDLGQYREAHFDLSQEDFGIQIVDVLEKRFSSISENWKEGWTAAH
ncbi:hypothetical protein B0H13DRAFT_2278616 [Mycena leptocephala]|nr:hypothetical protein B0H13DRAFT_2278616 [Mycena leptocephala]